MLEQTLGQQTRNQQLDIFEQREPEFLNHCRSLAIQIARREGEVSINDIRKHIQVPAGVHPSVLGAVFRTKQFQKGETNGWKVDRRQAYECKPPAGIVGF